jgi:F0F1-type ATP synthase membrane subunit c/vacuolar-type H+-ATPase subunit K
MCPRGKCILTIWSISMSIDTAANYMGAGAATVGTAGKGAGLGIVSEDMAVGYKRDPERSKALQQQMGSWGLARSTDVSVSVGGDTATFQGMAASQSDWDKLRLMALKMEGIRSVDLRAVMIGAD